MLTRFILIIAILPFFCKIIQAEEVMWQTDQPGYEPDLTYPIVYSATWASAGLALISQLDQEETGFEDPSFSNFYDGFQKGPRFDDNESKWNYIAHPLWGSETYLRARSQGLSAKKSFFFSAAASAFWEFGMEAFYQRPSSQDLIITPVTGSIIGELRFRAKRALCLDQSWQNQCLVFLLDPLQSVCEWIGHQFGENWKEPAYQLSQDYSSEFEQKKRINVSYNPYNPSGSVHIVYKQFF